MDCEQWVDGFELRPLPKTHESVQWARQKMSKTIVEHNGKKIAGYEIVEVLQVLNSDLWQKYRMQRDHIRRDIGGRVQEIRLFHGTNNALSIAESGFQVKFAKKSGMFGKGIYFADLSSKSNQYTFEGCNKPCKLHNEEFCEVCERTMLICRVAMGNQYKAQNAMNGIEEPPAGFHSVVAEPGVCKNIKYREYVIYQDNQAYPGYLVKYKIKK
ncbi:poly [ADP-ribose] polymerase tankyrase-2-like [Neocloeon triangulifer]|uniref:poly [ADP-ribose] polymerase tankyrase-2-like n=1 Tax=Neocloeon triangulifer TaxID=2078957 RepID=UPI00286F74EF|nr:poly [ADP-ribose] polymerase tankyrase-2-like [Neocloeon triangulifer]